MKPIIDTFKAVMMITLTIDPKLFGTAREAFEYVRNNRCLSEFVRGLHRAGHLETPRYFCVIEWQENGMAHWHMLLETERIPFNVLAQTWGRFRPKHAEPWGHSYDENLKGKPPEFGHVRFSKKPFASKEHAANYATKYLTKIPENGFPEWVKDMLDEGKQIKRYSTSHRFFGTENRPKKKAKPNEGTEETHPAECFCAECRTEPKAKKHRRTFRQRLAACGTGAIVVKVPIWHTAEGMKQGKPKFHCCLGTTYAEAAGLLSTDEKKGFFITEEELGCLKPLRRQLRESVIGGGVNGNESARNAILDAWNEGAAA